MNEETEKRIKQTKDICEKVLDAVVDVNKEDEDIDMGVSLNGVALALASLFLQYKEQEDDGISTDMMAEDFLNRLKVALKISKESLEKS